MNECTLPFCAEPTYLNINLDRALTFLQHFRVTAQEANIFYWAFRGIRGMKLGCGGHSTSHSLPCLGFFMAENCVLVWCHMPMLALSKSLLMIPCT